MRLKRIIVVAENGEADAAAALRAFHAENQEVRIVARRDQVATVAAAFAPDVIICPPAATGDACFPELPTIPVLTWASPEQPAPSAPDADLWELAGENTGWFDYQVQADTAHYSAGARRLLGLTAPPFPPLPALITRLPARDQVKVRNAWSELTAAPRRPLKLDLTLAASAAAPARSLRVALSFDTDRGVLRGVMQDRSETQRLAAALVEKDLYLERAQDLAQFGLYKLDLATGTWSSSAAMDAVFGIDEHHPHDVQGWLDLIAPAHREEMQRYLTDQVLGAHERFDRIYPIVRPCDGQLRWLHGAGELRYSDEGQPVAMIGTIQDITEQKEATDSLRRSEERFQILFSNLRAVAIHSYDPAGRVKHWNQAAELLFGYPAAAARKLTRAELIAHGFLPDHPDPHPENQSARKAMTGTGERSIRRQDGALINVFSSRIHIEQPGAEPELFCVDVDLTELRRAEELLRLQVSAHNAAANAIVITDRDGRIEWANRAFAQHTGFDPAEALGRNPRELIRSGQHDEAFYREMWETILAGRVWQGELINRHKDGHTFTEEMTITPILDARGEVSRFIAVKQDISHRRKLELQLRQSQKLDAIGRLAGGVAHDFNNILAAVLLNLEMLVMENDLGDDARESIREVTCEIKRGTALTRQLLAFGRKEAMQRATVDLPELVQGLFKMLGRLLGEQVRVRFDFAPDLPPLHADPGMIEQVVLNLCINARDAMPDGGELGIRAREVEVDAETAALHAAAPGRYLCLSVTDTGHGMTQDVLQHIFEPFYTTKSEGRGTGLGLSTVYGIAQQHRGWLTVDTAPGQGTSFHVHLPLESSRSHHARAPRTATPANLQGKGETVLVVEDDPSLLRSLASLLQRSNYQVLTATDGIQALDTWQDNPGRIALLFTDLTLPNGLSGRELIERLQAEQPGLRAVACSGYRQRELPADPTVCVLPKPFDYQQLLRTVREVLDAA